MVPLRRQTPYGCASHRQLYQDGDVATIGRIVTQLHRGHHAQQPSPPSLIQGRPVRLFRTGTTGPKSSASAGVRPSGTGTSSASSARAVESTASAWGLSIPWTSRGVIKTTVSTDSDGA